MIRNKRRRIKKASRKKLTTLILLVNFVFVIMLISIVISAGISYFLMEIGILPPMSVNRFPVILVFMLMVNLVIGTILAIVGGDYFLRPLRRLTEGTKEVAAGNFDVKVEVGGTSEISRLAISFNEMTKELSSIETLRNDFVNNVSHEFKTPIVSIRGFARRLKKNNLTEEQRNEYLDIIITETGRLTNLSSNVLLLSKLDSTDKVTDKTQYSLDEQIRRCILLFEPQLLKKQLELDVNLEPVQFIGNEEMIQPLWMNLLGNAIKFSPYGETIEVKLRLDGEMAIATISDRGIGMDDEVKKHVFDKFFQGDKSHSGEGNGLGLSLVNRILKLSNGKIAIKSELGKGSVFTVVLPLTDNSENTT